MSAEIHRQQTNARMSKIVSYSGMVFLAGQTAGGTEIPDVDGQTREALRRVDHLLGEAGTNKTRLLFATIFLKDMKDFVAMNAVWEAWLPQGAAPARATLQAGIASAHLLVEISIIAAAP